jgi:WD40 repeat protein
MIFRVTYSHRDDLIAVCAFKCVEVFEVSTGQRRALLARDENDPRSAAFSPEDTLIAIGCDSGIIDVWDLQTGSLVCALEGHTRRVDTIAFSPCGTTIGSGSDDNTVRIWDVPSHSCKCVLDDHSDDVRTICWLGAGRKVVSGSKDRTVKVWDVMGKKCLKTLKHDNHVTSLACSPDSSWIASGSFDGTVKIFDANAYDVFHTISTGHWITSIRFTSRHQLMYTTDELTYEIWDLTKKAKVLCFKHGGFGEAIASDGKSIASRNDKRNIVQLLQPDLTIDRKDLDFDSRNSVEWVAFSSDGHLAASGSFDCTVRLWDTVAGLCLHTGCGGIYFPVKQVTFSPDSRFLAAATRHEAQIWDIHTSTLILTLTTYSNVLRFSPNSGQLLSLGDYLTLWEAGTGSLLAKVRLHRKFNDVSFDFDGSCVILRSRQNPHSVERWRISPAPSSDHNLRPTRTNSNNYSPLPMVFVPMHDDQQHSLSPAIASHQYHYDPIDGWILDRQDRRVLWIPPNMRSYAYDCCGKKVIVGSPTGKVILVDFSDNQVEHPPCLSLQTYSKSYMQHRISDIFTKITPFGR